jgi:4'-phosphopantetheinyl transferase
MTIGNDEIHIWLENISMDLQKDKAVLINILSKDEYERSCKFSFSYLKDHFVACRANLRLILSYYINVNPQDIKFCYGKYGKPRLAQNNGVRFNLSHSENWAVYAISLGNEVGIDIEHIRSDRYSSDMEQLCFSKSEQKALENLPYLERVQNFYSLWTYKEALLKGLGYGLAYPLTELEIDISNVLYPEIKSNDPNLKDWVLYPLTCLKNFKSAISVKAKDQKILFKSLSDLKSLPQ